MDPSVPVSRVDKPAPAAGKPPSVPNVDRSSKPKGDPATKPSNQVKPMSVEIYKRKMAGLQPVPGSPVKIGGVSIFCGYKCIL